MKLYLVSQNVNSGYDTYDSMVVAANTEEEARRIHPSPVWAKDGFYNEEKKQFWNYYEDKKQGTYQFEDKYGSWTNEIEKIEVDYLGKADHRFTECEVICSSFNAG